MEHHGSPTAAPRRDVLRTSGPSKHTLEIFRIIVVQLIGICSSRAAHEQTLFRRQSRYSPRAHRVGAGRSHLSQSFFSRGATKYPRCAHTYISQALKGRCCQRRKRDPFVESGLIITFSSSIGATAPTELLLFFLAQFLQTGRAYGPLFSLPSAL